ncbi:hypothetical protein EVAR_37794_1 [Eumeta japonica]|uniref:Uncharacterized protein n=1 Tax=Eumeta variegata TaxID=151549 RepID=A0A4C1W7M5_EUMVA|nr:hypothetical protein EVAR_37794_1 [Eumeta japonica]
MRLTESSLANGVSTCRPRYKRSFRHEKDLIITASIVAHTPTGRTPAAGALLALFAVALKLTAREDALGYLFSSPAPVAPSGDASNTRLGNAANNKEWSGSVISALYVICSQFRAATFRALYCTPKPTEGNSA